MVFNCCTRSLCFKPWCISTEFMLSKLDKTTSCSMVASSRIFPFAFGFESRHSFAVMPNNATFNKSASLA